MLLGTKPLWVDVPTFKGKYQVCADLSGGVRVRSMPRNLNGHFRINGGQVPTNYTPRVLRGQVLKQTKHGRYCLAYLSGRKVMLSATTIYAATFQGEELLTVTGVRADAIL